MAVTNFSHPYAESVVTVGTATAPAIDLVIKGAGGKGPILIQNQGAFAIYLKPGGNASATAGLKIAAGDDIGLPSCTNGITAVRESAATSDCTVVVWTAQ